MSRRRHLIAYDIANDVRLRRVAKVMEGYGDRLQYSVFLCDLTQSELLSWRAEISSWLNLTEDSVVVIDLGPPAAVALEMIRRSRRLPEDGPVVV